MNAAGPLAAAVELAVAARKPGSVASTGAALIRSAARKHSAGSPVAELRQGRSTRPLGDLRWRTARRWNKSDSRIWFAIRYLRFALRGFKFEAIGHGCNVVSRQLRRFGASVGAVIADAVAIPKRPSPHEARD
jgi:hypothetical protein